MLYSTFTNILLNSNVASVNINALWTNMNILLTNINKG